MRNQRYLPPTSTTSIQLLLMGNVGIYSKATTPDRFPRQGTEQVHELKRPTLERGAPDDQITVFEDNGVSGSVSLLQRERNLLSAIKQETIDAVFVSNVTRLFQGAGANHVKSFIQMCLEQNILVLTPQCANDFHNEALVTKFCLARLESFRAHEKARSNMRWRKRKSGETISKSKEARKQGGIIVCISGILISKVSSRAGDKSIAFHRNSSRLFTKLPLCQIYDHIAPHSLCLLWRCILPQKKQTVVFFLCLLSFPHVTIKGRNDGKHRRGSSSQASH